MGRRSFLLSLLSVPLAGCALHAGEMEPKVKPPLEKERETGKETEKETDFEQFLFDITL